MSKWVEWMGEYLGRGVGSKIKETTAKKQEATITFSLKTSLLLLLLFPSPPFSLLWCVILPH